MAIIVYPMRDFKKNIYTKQYRKGEIFHSICTMFVILKACKFQTLYVHICVYCMYEQ